MNPPEWLEKTTFLYIQVLCEQREKTDDHRYLQSMQRLISTSKQAQNTWEKINKLDEINQLSLCMCLSVLMRDYYRPINRQSDLQKYKKISKLSKKLRELLNDDYLDSIVITGQIASEIGVENKHVINVLSDDFELGFAQILKDHEHLKLTNILSELSTLGKQMHAETANSGLYGNSPRARLIRRLADIFKHKTGSEKAMVITKLVELLLNKQTSRQEIYKIIN